MKIFELLILASWLVFIAYWVISAKGAKKIERRAGKFLSYGALTLIVIVMLISTRPYFHTQVFPQTSAVGTIAVILCAGGIAFAIWARRKLGRNWSPSPSVQQGHELVTSGPYRFVRHPIYTGMIAAMLGSAMVSDVAWCIALIFLCAMFVWRVKVEESLMTGLFPDQYPSYMKRTKALIPFVW